MRYLNHMTWTIIPTTLPLVRKHCSKCGETASFINTEKFRVNANKKALDIWLIYQCEKCKSTYNLTIFERIHPSYISRKDLCGFMDNDFALAQRFAFNHAIHEHNKVALDVSAVEYDILGDSFSIDTATRLTVQSEFDINLRVDKVLSQKLQVPRAQLKKLYQSGQIQSPMKNLLRRKIKTHIQIDFL